MVTKKMVRWVGIVIQYDREKKQTTQVEGVAIDVVRGTTTSFIKKYEQANGVKVVDIIDIKKEESTYTMSDEEFMKHAKKVSDASSGDKKEEKKEEKKPSGKEKK